MINMIMESYGQHGKIGLRHFIKRKYGSDHMILKLGIDGVHNRSPIEKFLDP